MREWFFRGADLRFMFLAQLPKLGLPIELSKKNDSVQRTESSGWIPRRKSARRLVPGFLRLNSLVVPLFLFLTDLSQKHQVVDAEPVVIQFDRLSLLVFEEH